MLFPHLLNRKSLVTELGELDKFFLNRLQSFLPLAVSNVGFCSLLASKPILFIQALNVGDFRPKTSYLFPQNFKMIHRCQDNSWREIDCTHRRINGGVRKGPPFRKIRERMGHPHWKRLPQIQLKEAGLPAHSAALRVRRVLIRSAPATASVREIQIGKSTARARRRQVSLRSMQERVARSCRGICMRCSSAPDFLAICRKARPKTACPVDA